MDKINMLLLNYEILKKIDLSFQVIRNCSNILLFDQRYNAISQLSAFVIEKG